MPRRVDRDAWANARRQGPVAAAVSAEVVQPMTSFPAADHGPRKPSAAGLGVSAPLYSCVILSTAVTTGMVGDLLTVLDVTTPGPGLQAVALSTLPSVGASRVLSWSDRSDQLGPGPLFGLAGHGLRAGGADPPRWMASLRFCSSWRSTPRAGGHRCPALVSFKVPTGSWSVGPAGGGAQSVWLGWSESSSRPGRAVWATMRFSWWCEVVRHGAGGQHSRPCGPP